jgi:predicted naringenin-chalcone synthase
MTIAIAAFGTAVPQTILDQHQGLGLARALACPTAEQETWLPATYAGTRIDTRHVSLDAQVVRDVLDRTNLSGSPYVPNGEPDYRGPTTAQRMEHYVRLAPPLAIKAAAEALANWGRPPSEITQLVTVSCTGFMAPGLDHALVAGLKLRPTVGRTHVGYMGCHGALNGLRVARAITGSDPRARVLLCAVELCCLHYHYTWNPQKMVANAIFADGAAALVGVPEGGAPAGAWRAVASGSCYLPDSAGAMTWTIGDHGFEMTLAKNVPALIGRHLRPWLEEWLGGEGLKLSDVGSWAIHPGGPRILEAAEQALGLTERDTAASHEVFARYGNMSSPTVLFVVRRLIESGAALPCVCLGFGPGLVAEAALLA